MLHCHWTDFAVLLYTFIFIFFFNYLKKIILLYYQWRWIKIFIITGLIHVGFEPDSRTNRRLRREDFMAVSHFRPQFRSGRGLRQPAVTTCFWSVLISQQLGQTTITERAADLSSLPQSVMSSASRWGRRAEYTGSGAGKIELVTSPILADYNGSRNDVKGRRASFAVRFIGHIDSKSRYD